MISQRFNMKLTLIFIMFIGISVLGAGLIAANKLKQTHYESLRESMESQLNIIAATMEWRDGKKTERIAYYNEWARKLAVQAGSRITFIAPDGSVLGDSDHDPLAMDNHYNRPELVEARATGSIGFSDRHSSTDHNDMLYSAVLVFDDRGEVAGYVRLAAPLREIQTYIQRLWSYLFIGFMLLFLAAGLVSYRVAKGLSSPLNKMTNVAQQIARTNYAVRVETNRRDELGLLGKAINQMAGSLQKQMVQIRENEIRLKNVLDHLQTGIVLIDEQMRIAIVNPATERLLGFKAGVLLGRKIDEAKQQPELLNLLQEAWNEQHEIKEELMFYYPRERHVQVVVIPLYSAAAESTGLLVALHDVSDIRRLERMRSEFVANVSHEIKTPIAAVRGFSETLLAGALDDRETAQAFLQIIHDESGRLDRLIADILHLSTIESKRIVLDFSPIELYPFITKTVEMMKTEAEAKQIQLSVDVQPELYIEADEDRLQQIVLNLISNAVHYTGEKGSVSIRVGLESKSDSDDSAEWIKISIADTGLGIPKKDLPRIFERFYRVDKARSRISGGTGLGLSIVKHLIDLHRGHIEVTSELGFGSTFIVRLPMIQEG